GRKSPDPEGGVRDVVLPDHLPAAPMAVPVAWGEGGDGGNQSDLQLRPPRVRDQDHYSLQHPVGLWDRLVRPTVSYRRRFDRAQRLHRQPQDHLQLLEDRLRGLYAGREARGYGRGVRP